MDLVDPANPPSRKAPLVWAIGAAIPWLVLAVAQVVWFVVDSRLAWLHIAAAAVTALGIVVFVVVVPLWRYRVHRWDISPQAVYTRSGWLVQERRIAPISRVQTVDTYRGPLDRLFGLANVTVTTASSAGAVRIVALDSDGRRPGRRPAHRHRRDRQREDARRDPAPATERVWHRLSPRMLLVHPVHEVLRQIPLLIGAVVLGSATGNPMWSVAALGVTVGFGILRWFTTTYRIEPDEVQLRTGVLQRKVVSVPRNRIRSVQTDARLLHQLLGLTVLRVSTGQEAKGDTVFALDAVRAEEVPRLRSILLADSLAPADDTGDQRSRRAGCWRAGSRPGCGTAR